MHCRITFHCLAIPAHYGGLWSALLEGDWEIKTKKAQGGGKQDIQGLYKAMQAVMHYTVREIHVNEKERKSALTGAFTLEPEEGTS